MHSKMQKKLLNSLRTQKISHLYSVLKKGKYKKLKTKLKYIPKIPTH